MNTHRAMWPLLPTQVVCLLVVMGLGYVSGLGLRVWLLALGPGGGAVLFAWWLRHRGSGALTLPELRRATRLSAMVAALAAAGASAGLSTAELSERAAVAVGSALAVGFGVGVLTLCGLSLGLGASQPVTTVLPDPAHPHRGRRRVQD